MSRLMCALALLCLAASALPPSWPPRHYVRWRPAWGSRTIEAGGLRTRVAVERCGAERPLSESCSEGAWLLAVTVLGDGRAPLTITGDPGVASYVGIGQLTPDADRPSLILVSDGGGSGGCVGIALAVPEEGGYRPARLGGGTRSLCAVNPATLAWPHDLTGRGLPDFRLVDDAFACRFTSCAGSWYPPKILALDGARSIDVSSDPALAPLFRADMARARYACEHRSVQPQGACAGYAADAARLGLLAQAWPVIDAQARRGCRVTASSRCPDDNRIPPGFLGNLSAMLAKAGYR